MAGVLPETDLLIPDSSFSGKPNMMSKINFKRRNIAKYNSLEAMAGRDLREDYTLEYGAEGLLIKSISLKTETSFYHSREPS
tara:strand:+ start:241 stop:486 length:246 start_codon:yes stop_codon:yes gene_type:complete